MLELKIAFDFRCSLCGHSMGVTLACAGNGLHAGQRGWATVKVPCPTCHENNRLYFSTDGVLHEVEPENAGLMQEPSLN